MKIYNVHHIPTDQLDINGKVDHKLWKEAVSLTDFCSPWKTIENTTTEFKALWDDTHLFFCFYVMDETIHIDKTDDSNSSINVSDRVELFFRLNASLHPYYCIEIDPIPRIMDFKAKPNKNFDFNWNWPKNDLKIKSHLHKNGFSVEGKISIASLKKMNLLKNNCIETGIYRAKYSKTEELNYEPTWLSWINPETSTPNFHTASSFGVLKLN